MISGECMFLHVFEDEHEHSLKIPFQEPLNPAPGFRELVAALAPAALECSALEWEHSQVCRGGR